MREAHHPKLVAFRAGDRLVAAIKARAESTGQSVSEFVRSVVRDKVETTTAPGIELPVHLRAGQGDPEAFSRLADIHYQNATSGTVPPLIALSLATAYARLAGCGRGAREDYLTLIFLASRYADALREVGLTEMADASQAEAVTLADHMADEGDEQVAGILAASGSVISPEVLAISRDFQKTTKGYLDAVNCAASAT